MATATKRGRVRPKPPLEGAARAFRGLLLVYLLSSLSLAGVLLTIAALGGLGRWSAWQFVGAFGLLEAGSGLANIISPNIWRLPIAETQTRTPVKLSASSMLLPHWGAAARSAAGLTLMAASASMPASPRERLCSRCLPSWSRSWWWQPRRSSPASESGGLTWTSSSSSSGAPAETTKLEPVSIGASSLQFLLSIATIPFVKAFAPGVLFQPEFSPSAATLSGAAGLALALTRAALVAWRGRIDWSPPRGRQGEAQRWA